ncbi:hypothetical protein MKY34_17800 [Sporosarcina sp. FSL K6-1522]|uniref:hypothetical protein n=1 Tax=Sporosarcina sp. FSL K6-1522 TaxID=2921554 RepID=UPI00315B1416
MNEYFVDSEIYEYPDSYRKIVGLNLLDFDIWYLMESEQATRRYFDLKKRYPNRRLVPFARRDDNDDIACFEIGKGSRVQIIHDFTSEGFEQRKEFKDFWEWVAFIIGEMIECNREEEVE